MEITVKTKTLRERVLFNLKNLPNTVIVNMQRRVAEQAALAREKHPTLEMIQKRERARFIAEIAATRVYRKEFNYQTGEYSKYGEWYRAVGEVRHRRVMTAKKAQNYRETSDCVSLAPAV